MPRKDRQSRQRSRTTRPAKQPAYVRTTITIPRELKARMEKVGSRVNWSAIASEAFQSQLSEFEAKEQAMPELPDRDDALERLRRLRNEPESRGGEESNRAYMFGKRWAMADAHPNELQRLEAYLARSDLSRPRDESTSDSHDRREVKELFREITLTILGYVDRPGSHPADVEEMRREMKSFWRERVGLTVEPGHGQRREFLSEFTRGAFDFWKEAKDHL